MGDGRNQDALDVSIVDTLAGADVQALLASRYRLLGLLGQGGMGSVYRALDMELGEVVALKMLRRELAERTDIVERFRREVTLARKVTHRNVARVYDIGQHAGDRFITMEFIEGQSLAHRLAQRRPSLRTVWLMAEDICAGLVAAHAAGVVHRDLKPDNVMIALDGRVVVTDFGIARLADVACGSNTMGTMLGTPAYMAPEQVEGLEIDGRTDLYAFGVVLFEMTTGRLPFDGASAFAVAAARLTTPAADPRAIEPTLPAEVASLILRLLARAPAERFANAEELAAALVLTRGAALGDAPATDRPSMVGSLPSSTPPAPVAPQPSDKSVAVLLFRNLGSEADAYIADELTDDLIDGLSMSGALRVRPRGAVQRFAKDDRDPGEVGGELGVQVVVQGSVRRAGERLRISARAISVADGFQLWAKRFEQPFAEVLDVSDTIAAAIVEALTVAPRAAQARDAPSNPEVVELYLQGRQEYRRFYPPFVMRAIGLYRRALAIAPDDPMVLAGLASAMARVAHFGMASFGEAEALAQRAVTLAPKLADAHLALALTRAWTRPVDAMRALRPALALAPGLPEVQFLVGSLLSEAGSDQGLLWLEAVYAVDPGLPLGLDALCRHHMQRRDCTRAMEVWEESITRPGHPTGPSTWRLPMAYRDATRMDRMAMKFESTGHPFAKYANAAREALRGRGHDTVLSVFTELGKGFRDPLWAQMETEIAMLSGQTERALAYVLEATNLGLADITWIEGTECLDVFHGQPTYEEARATVRQRANAVIAAFSRSG